MAETEKPSLKEQVALLPLSPGVYQFVDRSGTIIYVGKAKSLRKRVSSYFVQSKEHSAKVRVLVRQIAEIRHIVVSSETDALLLENSLIKTLQPRYNILLKDDKTYPWIVVRREHFPRVQSTRNLTRDGSQYFGPLRLGDDAAQRARLHPRGGAACGPANSTSLRNRSPRAGIRSACSIIWATARVRVSVCNPKRSMRSWSAWSFRC